MKIILTIICRDLRLAMRQVNDNITVLSFFFLVAALFPLAIGPENNILERISAGIVWVAAMLSALLSLDRLFLADYEDGSLETLAMLPIPLTILVLGKIIAHWLTTGLPLMLSAPLMAVLLHLDKSGFVILMATMALGTPTISLFGAMGSALALGARRGGVLVSLLVLPLCVPVLIFGAGAIDLAIQGMSPVPQLLLMGGLFLTALPLAPWAASAALRQAME